MTGSIADVFRRFAAAADEQERDRFLEAARVLFALDPELKRKPWRQRNRLLKLAADTAPNREKIEASLLQCVENVAKDVRAAERTGAYAYDSADSAENVLLGRRILAAYVITRGLPPFQDKVALLNATVLLHQLNDDAQESDKGERARKGQAHNPKRGAREAGWKALRREAAQLLSEPNAPARKTARAKELLKRLGGRVQARKPKDLIEVARRQRIEI